MTDTLAEAARALLDRYADYARSGAVPPRYLRDAFERLRVVMSAPPRPSAEPPEGYLKIVKKERVPFVVDPSPPDTTSSTERAHVVDEGVNTVLCIGDVLIRREGGGQRWRNHLQRIADDINRAIDASTVAVLEQAAQRCEAIRYAPPSAFQYLDSLARTDMEGTWAGAAVKCQEAIAALAHPAPKDNSNVMA